jgi:hypothetical protein
MDTVQVTLPSGLPLGGEWHRIASLRPLRGGDELFLAESAMALDPAARTTTLLTRCLTRLGSIAEVGAEHVRALSVGDRDALLLHLRRVSFGDRIAAVLSCPKPECREKMDLELNVTDLLVTPARDARAVHDISVADSDGCSYAVRFRVPTGADLEAVAGFARHQPAAAAEALIERCVLNVNGDAFDRTALPAAVRAALPALMAELDPQAEATLQVMCPACATAFGAVFDIGDFLQREITAGRAELLQQIHTLALHYHWSETEILDLPPMRRRLYLEMLSANLAGASA